jgi:hypothetical protein
MQLPDDGIAHGSSNNNHDLRFAIAEEVACLAEPGYFRGSSTNCSIIRLKGHYYRISHWI